MTMIYTCPQCHMETIGPGLCAQCAADSTLIRLLDLREKITRCRAAGLLLTANTLRHQAMSLAECFVDPVWASEQEEQTHPPPRSGRAMAAEREIVDGVLAPF